MNEPVIAKLEQTIRERRNADARDSYVASLFAKGLPKIAQKLGEEATETIIAALSGTEDELVSESADLLFHWMVLLSAKNISFEAVLAGIERREGLSGLAEKAARGE